MKELNFAFAYSWSIALLVIIQVTGCGEATFGTSTGKKPTPVPQESPGTSAELAGLDWYWKCDSEAGEAPAQQEGHKLIAGKGEHSMSEAEFEHGVPVSISGKVCQPAKYPRDIVFVIDVSGSMADTAVGNDKIVANSCNRMRAIETIISDAQNSDARFGIVIFSSTAVKSTKMFTDKATLFADIGIAGSSTSDGVICGALGGTYYGIGLTGAQELLSKSRKGALKEVYIVSDGEPSDELGPDYLGSLTLSKQLKSTGVTIEAVNHPVQIATAMIGTATDQYIIPLASVDKAGKSLHAGSVRAADLAKTLRVLSENKIDDGTLKYRPVGTDAWTSIALKENMKGYDFKIPTFNLSPSEAPDGLEVLFEYHDEHKNVYSSGGTIKWQAQK